uniref:Uncharacterized protein n=1 Tax=Onchocerca volvulus TaxID=6282 RepID=A0A8R1TRP1_ONCVO
MLRMSESVNKNSIGCAKKLRSYTHMEWDSFPAKARKLKKQREESTNTDCYPSSLSPPLPSLRV